MAAHTAHDPIALLTPCRVKGGNGLVAAKWRSSDEGVKVSQGDEHLNRHARASRLQVCARPSRPQRLRAEAFAIVIRTVTVRPARRPVDA